jgi:nitroreductase
MVKTDLYKLIIARRTVRLFKQKKAPLAVIKKVIDAARLAPSAANLQFLEYLVVYKKELRKEVFKHLRWAAYISPKRNPPAGSEPVFYVIILTNSLKSGNPNLRDIGAAAENILISLLAFGLGACWLQNIDKTQLTHILKIKPPLEIDSLIAAGYPAESPKLETDSQNIKYWLDKRNILHIPKRPLKEILHYNYIKSRE